MKFKSMKNVRDGRFLHNYILTYENKMGKDKEYEITSRHVLSSPKDLGNHVSGISIIAICNNKMVLLHEFRMAVNRPVYNLIAGMLEINETVEQCIHREIYEETGLTVERIDKILRPSFAAVGISDVSTHIAIVHVTGTIEDHTSDNEEIRADLYDREQILALLETEDFSSRAQFAAYAFANGLFD